MATSLGRVNFGEAACTVPFFFHPLATHRPPSNAPLFSSAENPSKQSCSLHCLCTQSNSPSLVHTQPCPVTRARAISVVVSLISRTPFGCVEQGRTGSRHVSHLLWGKRSLWIGKIGISAASDSTGACKDTCIHACEVLGNYSNTRSADIVAIFIPSCTKHKQWEFHYRWE